MARALFCFSRVNEGVAIMATPVTRECHSIYLFEMMERLGIEPGGGVVARLGLRYATAFHRCEACLSKQTCRDWLDRMPRSVVIASSFCPAADILSELQVDQPICNHTRSDIESENTMKGHAYIGDLERLEAEIDEILICKSTDDSSIADLKRRKLHLRNMIERLHH